LLPNYDAPPAEGNCKGHDVDKWFPVIEKGLPREQWLKFRADTKEAIELCNSCPSMEHCLEYSLRHEPIGIWGGKTEAERAMMRSDKGILLSREARIFLPGIGRRNANGFAYKGNYRLKDAAIKKALREAQ
jgi:hypothetical protein